MEMEVSCAVKPNIFDIPLIAHLISLHLTSGDIRSCLQVSRSWYATFEPQIWHRLYFKSLWVPSWPTKRAILRNAHRIQHLDIEDSFFLYLSSSEDGYHNGEMSPCAHLKSLRIKDKNIDYHPRHEYHTILDRPLSDNTINNADHSISLTGSVDALTLDDDPSDDSDPIVAYEPNQAQAVLDMIDASPDLRSLALELECNSTLFCMALCKSLSRLHSLETFKWTFACFFDFRLLWAFLWLLPNIQSLELLGHCMETHQPPEDRDDGSGVFFDRVARLVQDIQARETDPSTIRAEHGIRHLVIEGSLWYFQALPELVLYLERSPHLTNLKLPTISSTKAESLIPVLLRHCPVLCWIELCSHRGQVSLESALSLARAYHNLTGFAVGIEPTAVKQVVQALKEHSAESLEHFEIWGGSTTYANDTLVLLTEFPRLQYLALNPAQGPSALLSELVAIVWGCPAMRYLRLHVCVDSHGVEPDLGGNVPRIEDPGLMTKVAQQTLALFCKLKQMKLKTLKLAWSSTIKIQRREGLEAMGHQMTERDLAWMNVQWSSHDDDSFSLFDD
ncbi:hypothetical protein CPB97_001895 [Podila verticillata]|nr:hypothetical protein CPB97_001895 [Podila verticillata]